MKLSRARYLSYSLALIISLGPIAEAGTAPVGTLLGDGKVMVNGKVLSASQPAFPGDTLEAPKAAMGTIQIAPNGVARMTADARVSVERSGENVWLGLQRGYVAVREGNRPMSVRAHGGMVTAEPGAIFEVAQVKGITFVTAVKGSAILSEGGLLQNHTVPQGQTVQVAFLEPGPLGYPQAAPANTERKTRNDCNTKKSKELRDKCEPLQDACAKDSTKCPEYHNTCSALVGCACTSRKNKELQEQCKPLRQACAKDSTKCPEYRRTCEALVGCAGWASLGTGAAGSAATSAAAAAATAAVQPAVTAVAVTAAAVAGTAAAVAIPTAAASQSGNDNTISSIVSAAK